MELRVMVRKRHQEWFQTVAQECVKNFGAMGTEDNGPYLDVTLYTHLF